MGKLEELELQVKDLQSKISSMEGGSKQEPYRRHYSIEQFKKTFKIGDVLTGWSTGKQVKITAIGQKKFLALDHYGRERTCSIETYHWAAVQFSYEGHPLVSDINLEMQKNPVSEVGSV